MRTPYEGESNPRREQPGEINPGTGEEVREKKGDGTEVEGEILIRHNPGMGSSDRLWTSRSRGLLLFVRIRAHAVARAAMRRVLRPGRG
jgi:hypothetical protein